MAEGDKQNTNMHRTFISRVKLFIDELFFSSFFLFSVLEFLNWWEINKQNDGSFDRVKSLLWNFKISTKLMFWKMERVTFKKNKRKVLNDQSEKETYLGFKEGN